MSIHPCSSRWSFSGPIDKLKTASSDIAQLPEVLIQAEDLSTAQKAALEALDVAHAKIAEQIDAIRAAIEDYDGTPKNWTGG